ncbi:hypothetical protein [Nocardiopsis sp. LOL_012]|uniref:hypothetical protein n=1 Tax=Nocardiopsis sp. LOL_012 TaxID=3345409 RepID=UPI003A8BBAE1
MPASRDVRPVFDPGLPPNVAARLRDNPEVLIPKSRLTDRRPLRRPLLVAGGTALAALNLAWAAASTPTVEAGAFGAYIPGALAHAALVGAAGIAALRTTPRSWLPEALREGRRRDLWTLFCATPLPLSCTVFVLGSLWWPPAAALLSVYSAAALWVAFGWTARDRFATAHAHRYLVPEDFSSSYSALLTDVQRTVDRLQEAGEEFDAAEPLSALRAEEWRIASSLHRYQRQRAEYLKKAARAADRQERSALARQYEQQEQEYRELSRQRHRILEYGKVIEEALRTPQGREEVERALASGELLSADRPDGNS